MTYPQVEIAEVIYNPAEQAFEARVTVHDAGKRHVYPCSINAPITMEYARAARGLARQALRRHGSPQPLRSTIAPPQTQAGLLRRIHRMLRRGLPLGEFGYHRGRAA